MSDIKKKTRAGIDSAASKAKDVAGKLVDKSKSAARSTGEAITRTGEKLKNAGKNKK